MQLFQELLDNNQLESWVPLLDWLLSNDRCSKQRGWGQKKKRDFTTQIQTLIGSDNWQIQAAKNVVWEFEESDNVHIVMNNAGSAGESLLRHIRNGIAHGMARIVQRNNDLYLDLKDYHNESCNTQTAHVWMPIGLLFDIHSVYKAIEAKNNHDGT